MTTPSREISVVEPISPALEHVKRMLFQPFDLGKWFVIGFCAWLAYLGEAGGGSGGGDSTTSATIRTGTGQISTTPSTRPGTIC